ncbi:hypothetical protein QY881_08775 [Latilactobacillus sakei]|uniref:hypothetical protein n=1 Tax=Latilactobacillus sakei TaxID=1599 RepID=UPI0030790075
MDNVVTKRQEELSKWIDERKSVLNKDFPACKYPESNHPKMFNELLQDEQVVLVNWILTTLTRAKTINRNDSSYGLKHYFENSPLGFYVSNGAMKGALLIAGFETRKIEDLNWYFNVSKVSAKQARLASENWRLNK